MKFAPLIALALTLTATGAMSADAKATAAAKKRIFLDLSSEVLMDKATAQATMAEVIPEKLWKVYPASKWGFVSQVEGGFNSAKICVVTARVMLTPLTVTNGLIMRPEERVTTFDALPGATTEQCKKLAKDKLREATEGVVSSLIKK